MISGCSSLCEFPTGMRSMESLKEIYADRTRNIALIPRSREVQQWDLPGCLVKLSLGCGNLSDASFPKDFCNLPFLEYLNLDGNLIRRLPDCIRTLNRLKELSLSFCPLLQSVEGLPSTVEDLSVSDSKSLEIIKSTSNLVYINSWDCENLAEVEGCCKLVGIENVDKRIIKNLGLLEFQVEDKVVEKMKVRYEFGIFTTFIPGKELVESWFDYIDRSGSGSVYFIVPDVGSSSKKRRIRGLNVCVAFHLHDKRNSYWYDGCEISNRTKDLRWTYYWHPFVVGNNQGVRKDGYIWWKKDGKYEDGIIMLSHWRLGNWLEVGDHLTVDFVISSTASFVKEMGLKVVYDDEGEDDDHEGK